MSKILFMNSSPNKNGNTMRIGKSLLKDISYDVIQMSDYKVSQYGNVYEDDQINDIFKEIKDKEIIIIGAPIYWYTVGGLLKTFIDRLYLLPEAEILKGKNYISFAQGSAPDDGTIRTIEHLADRVSELMGMELKGVVVDSSDGNKIISNISIEA